LKASRAHYGGVFVAISLILSTLAYSNSVWERSESLRRGTGAVCSRSIVPSRSPVAAPALVLPRPKLPPSTPTQGYCRFINFFTENAWPATLFGLHCSGIDVPS
jgi:hypothetical protein